VGGQKEDFIRHTFGHNRHCSQNHAGKGKTVIGLTGSEPFAIELHWRKRGASREYSLSLQNIKLQL